MSNTSSKVKPSPKNLLDLLLAGELFIVAIGKGIRKNGSSQTANNFEKREFSGVVYDDYLLFIKSR